LAQRKRREEKTAELSSEEQNFKVEVQKLTRRKQRVEKTAALNSEEQKAILEAQKMKQRKRREEQRASLNSDERKAKKQKKEELILPPNDEEKNVDPVTKNNAETRLELNNPTLSF